jgi:tetratricopeptide (TPR) repeat protein
VTGFSTRDLAELVGLSAAQVRSYVRAGLVAPERGPTGEYRFSFQDVSILRTARTLLDSRIPPRRVRRALRRLREQLPAGVPLSAVSIGIDGDRILARHELALWNPESGQTLFDFSAQPAAGRVAPLEQRRADRLRHAWDRLEAFDWCGLAAELEGVAPAEAREAYGHALALDPTNADAHVNLGRVLHAEGRLREAERHYRLALDRDPLHATAAFNLGVVLEDQGRLRDALHAYELALGCDPMLADAHFNLAGLYERLGEPAAALRHLGSYKRLTEGS